DLSYVMRAGDRVVAEAKSVLVAYDYEHAHSVELPAEWRGRLGARWGASGGRPPPTARARRPRPCPQTRPPPASSSSPPGSRYETPDTNGIAHFAEHMFFKGTERRPTARDIGVAIDGIGGEFNAFTGKEYTGYYVRCASEHRAIALDVLTDMLRHSKFEPE